MPATRHFFKIQDDASIKEKPIKKFIVSATVNDIILNKIKKYYAHSFKSFSYNKWDVGFC